MTEEIFKPRARLLLQLGNELIRNESIAILELVKNSYDADATRVSLTMQNVDDVEKGIIVIEDNGTGMDMETIQNVWMEPGSDYKTGKTKRITKKFGRMVLGEKGIGRFAVHKLGDVIELTTRFANKKEIFIKIDWNIFNESKYLHDVSIDIVQREPEVFKGKSTGTKITIKKIREPWNRESFRSLYRSYNSLRSPFDSPSSFDIKFKTNRENWLEGLLSWEDVKDFALFKFLCEIEGSCITKFRYEFNPWKNMDKLKKIVITEKNDFGKTLKMVNKNNESIDISKHKIGKIRFEGTIFDLDPKILELGMQEHESVGDKQGLRDYLKMNGGVKVFRDGVRVYDYGEPGNDWLDLDIRRVNVPTKRISNNLILSAVSLDRKTSLDLVEKTNREGFIENETYFTFVQAILYALERVESLRKIDKERIRLLYGPTPKSEPIISRLSEIKKTIKKKIDDKKLQKELNYNLDRIEEDYKTIHSTLLKSAGAGLSLSVAIHEMDKVISELLNVASLEKTSKRILNLVTHLRKLVEGYTVAIRKTTKQEWQAFQLVDQALFNLEFRFAAHKIDIEFANKEKAKKIKIKCARSLVVTSMMNILDNSLWWLEYGKRTTKKIFIGVYVDSPHHTTILLADNGPGFTLPTDMITEPNISAKPDGMGLGLHIAKEVLKAHKGRLVFPEWGDFQIPKEYRNGAIVALQFPREKKY